MWASKDEFNLNYLLELRTAGVQAAAAVCQALANHDNVMQIAKLFGTESAHVYNMQNTYKGVIELT